MFIVTQMFGLIKKAYKERRRIVKVKKTKLVLKILQLFYDEGLIKGFFLGEDLKTVVIFLKYYENKNLIQNFKMITTSRREIYASAYFLSKYLNSNGLFVLTTNKYGLIFSNRLLRNNTKFLRKEGGIILFQLFL